MITLITLLALGVILLVLDIAFIPGMFVGILGGILIVAGVFTAYSTISTTAGHTTLAGSIIFMGLLLYYFIKTDVWSKFALNDTIASKVNEHIFETPLIGTFGKAISDLRPGGKAEFGDKIFEVQTLGQFCKAGSQIKIIYIQNQKITVEPV